MEVKLDAKIDKKKKNVWKKWEIEAQQNHMTKVGVNIEMGIHLQSNWESNENKKIKDHGEMKTHQNEYLITFNIF